MKTKSKILSIMLVILVVGTSVPSAIAINNSETKNKKMECILTAKTEIVDMPDRIPYLGNLPTYFPSKLILKLVILLVASVSVLLFYRFLRFLRGPYFPPGYHGI